MTGCFASPSVIVRSPFHRPVKPKRVLVPDVIYRPVEGLPVEPGGGRVYGALTGPLISSVELIMHMLL